MRLKQESYINILDDVKLSSQELLKYAYDLSLIHKVYMKNTEYRHINLGEARRDIENAYAAAKKDKYKGLELPALSEWFYDNRYLFIEQIKQIEINKNKYVLPHIKSGQLAHYPRSFVLAIELARHSSFYITINSMQEFLEAYQKETELDSGELWVFADMLKIAILYAVAELGKRSLENIYMRRRAEKFCELAEKDTAGADQLIMENKSVFFNPMFIEHVMVLMRESPNISEITEKINARLASRDLSVERLVRKAHTSDANNIMYISNAISSLRMLAKINFESIFEKVSAVHRHLSEDADYVRMDFSSREYYRENVADIASIIKVSEPAVSRAAVRLSKQTGEHVGAFIVGQRRYELMKAFGGIPFKEKVSCLYRKHMLLLYAGGTFVSSFVSAALLCITLFFMYPIVYGIIGFIICFIPIYAVAAAASNKIFMLLNKPVYLPRIDFKNGIPEDCATMVAVTALVTSLGDGQDILEKMQVYYAANLKENLYFTLLSDFKENSNDITPDDKETISRIEAEVDALNLKYGRKVFFYAQRKRTYDRLTGKFSGRERKRGALLDFCNLLRGSGGEFIYVTSDIPQYIKYVITLDVDTELSRDAAIDLIGAMEHPLSRPVIDEKTNTVKSGYSIMQPRIGIDVVSAARTHFSLVFSGKGGLDTYACATSDVYQDGFGTGIYTGKGIFNVSAYKQVLENAFPDGSILSHDLLEGAYLRCALITNVVLMDGYPGKYLSWAERQHRWARGDWQLLPRLKRFVRTKDGKTRNPLSGLSKYQILDNIRRSLVMPLSFVVILLSQTAFYRSAFFWFISGILPLFIDGILDFAFRILTLIRNAGKGTTVKDAVYETKSLFEQSFYKFAFLPFEAYSMLDAAIRTLYRLTISRKKLLEWVTAAEGEKKAKESLKDYWREMKAAPILAGALFALSIISTRTFSIVAFAVFAVWFFAPSIAFLISRPRRTRRNALEPQQREYLENIALRTWRFFEKFGNENEYCWMPDNYQQSPKKGAALRTSPTNIAFSMTSGIIAYYMGFCTLSDAAERLERCVTGIEKAEKWEGHLYNWYDITDLKPLEPRYVSSVDSGNLACYLIVAGEALKDMILKPISAFMPRGLSAAARQTNAGFTVPADGGIFGTIELLDSIGEDSGKLYELKKSFTSYLGKFAGWAPLLSGLPGDGVYEELIQKLKDSLINISIVQYIEEFHALLELISEIVEKATKGGDKKTLQWVKSMETALTESYVASRRLCTRLDKLGRRMAALFEEMDFSVLYDHEKDLFSIGFDIRQGKLSDTHYDLLASEARQTGFIAIAKGDVPGKHWFRLARPLTIAGDSRVLLSWGGTMFEYLMPLIIMKSYDNTLLAETYKNVVAMQSGYGDSRRVPWGVSESGYYAFDLQMNYQYKAFGVPGLGMKSGLVREIVISPYAVFLALLVNSKAALNDLIRFQKAGALGRYGFYEAIDYTQSRMQKGRKKRVIKSYMAHHQGMIFASILNCLQEGKMQELFHSAMCVRATEMLLKEKVPPRNVTLSFSEKQPEHQEFVEEIHSLRSFRHFVQYPEGYFLSNGSYTVMLTQYGTGYSMYRGNIINRWYGDCLRRVPGIFIYLKNMETGAVWSVSLLPTCVRSDQERVVFEQHKITFVREIGEIETTLEVCVSPECDLEIRDLQINNKGERKAPLSVLCVYTPALCGERAFAAHPAFTELFLETEADAENKTIYSKRRGDGICTAMKVCGAENAELLTDRTNIYGRQTIFGAPACLAGQYCERDFQRAAGIRCSLTVPGKSISSLSFVIAAGETKQEVTKCLSGITGEDDVKRVFNLAWTHSQVEMRFLKLRDMQADLFQRIASRTVIGIPPSSEYPGKADGVNTLWKLGISGDLPIICMFAHSAENIETIRMLAKAQEFMSFRSVSADLVYIFEGGTEYLSPLRDRIRELEQAASGRPYNKVYAFAKDSLTDSDIATVTNASCLVLNDGKPILEQLKADLKLRPYEVFENGEREVFRIPTRLKAFDNGTGGYVSGGAEYCIDTGDKAPYPWSNLLVNREFGSIVSAGGGGYTWAGNAQLKRLTPFRNDPLTDINGEGIIIRNDRTGKAFSAAPDSYSDGKYRVIHGFGYTVFERYGNAGTKATCFVDSTLPVKATLLDVENNSSKTDTYSVYYFAEPAIVGNYRHLNSEFINGRLEASSSFDDTEKIMFISIPGTEVKYTSSAYEFFGSPGNNVMPEALKVKELSNTGGICTLLALQMRLTLAPREKKRLVLIMGYGNGEETTEISEAMGGAREAEERLAQTKALWQNLIGRIRIKTSNKSFDTLVNGWLVYQTYASRIWGRTGYYQSGGAFGFRDQLQDSLALLYTDPLLVRGMILRFAGKQFPEGDVLHWWHEPAHGVRTKISDDKLFLPYTTCEYTRVTGDMSVFDEEMPYLEGKEVPEGARDIYEDFKTSGTSGTVFEHCVKAIESALKFGQHGLPLMGTGDWNDGMDKVGEEGKGESVWLAFFLTEVLTKFSEACRKKGNEPLAQKYEEQREELRKNIEVNAWDGDWYLRAFFDDGTPLGSRGSPECRIDLISQAWAAITGAERAKKAFESAGENLVMREEGVIRLLDPAFDKWDKDPGYIKSYHPGLRENGGQYSHAAVWYVIAATKLREKERAFELFQMINPINHTRTPAGVARYKGEPYVVAGDVYYSDEFKGRAGWTWYTGTAGWLYQTAIVHLLGMRIENGELRIYPCLPDGFGKYTIEYFKDGAEYIINVDLSRGYEGPALLSIDGGEPEKSVKLDKREGVHQIYACWKDA